MKIFSGYTIGLNKTIVLAKKIYYFESFTAGLNIISLNCYFIHFNRSFYMYKYVLFIVVFFTGSFSQTIVENEIVGEDNTISVSNESKVVTARNAIQTYPFGLFVGNIVLNYEKLINYRHGLFIQANANISGNEQSGLSLQYRYHYYTKLKHKGFNSPFWGPFFTINSLNMAVWEDDGYERVNYNAKVNSAIFGVNWGRRWVWNSGLNIVFRIGYGISNSNFEWSPTLPQNVEAMERLITLVNGIDGELSLGFVF
jgi:hypothetical protein